MRVKLASMEPSSAEDGDVCPGFPVDRCSWASMEPSSAEDGDYPGMISPKDPAKASMEPSSAEDGDNALRNPANSRKSSFNGAVLS